MFLYFPANICGPCFTPFVGLHGNALFRKSLQEEPQSDRKVGTSFV